MKDIKELLFRIRFNEYSLANKALKNILENKILERHERILREHSDVLPLKEIQGETK